MIKIKIESYPSFETSTATLPTWPSNKIRITFNFNQLINQSIFKPAGEAGILHFNANADTNLLILICSLIKFVK